MNVNETIEIKLLMSQSPEKKMLMASRRMAVSGNTLLRAIFSSVLTFLAHPVDCKSLAK